MNFCPQECYGYFNLILSGPTDVAILKWKVYKTSAKIKDIFFIQVLILKLIIFFF